MKTFDQITNSDCFRACLYTLLQSDMDLPESVDKISGKWSQDFIDTLTKRYGYRVLFNHFLNPPATSFHLPRLIAAGPTVRGGGNHAVVWDLQTASMLHDPHVSRVGILRVETWYHLQRIN